MGVVVRRYIDMLTITIYFPYNILHLYLISLFFVKSIPILLSSFLKCFFVLIIESVDSISRDERGLPLTQYITNGRI